MAEFKWGLIGSIDKAKYFAEDLKHTEHPHVLHAIVVQDDENISQIQVPEVYNDIRALLKSEIDAVYIATSFDMHFQLVSQCLQAGVPVLCERPIAQSAEELSRLMHLSQHTHTFMMEAMWIRFLPSIKKMLSILSSDAIGEIVSVKASLSYKNNEAFMENTAGSALFELGIYPVFLCTLLLGRPEYVQATGNFKNVKDDFFSAFLSYGDGQYGFIEVTQMTLNNSLAVVTGTKGILQIKNPWSLKPEGIEVDFFDGTKVLHKSEWHGRGLQFELDEVYENVQAGSIESQMYCHHFSLDVMHTMDNVKVQLLKYK